MMIHWPLCDRAIVGNKNLVIMIHILWSTLSYLSAVVHGARAQMLTDRLMMDDHAMASTKARTEN